MGEKKIGVEVGIAMGQDCESGEKTDNGSDGDSNETARTQNGFSLRSSTTASLSLGPDEDACGHLIRFCKRFESKATFPNTPRFVGSTRVGEVLQQFLRPFS